MSQSMTPTSFFNEYFSCNSPTQSGVDELLRWAFGAGEGAVVAAISGLTSPLGGAVFGTGCWFGSRLVSWICDKMNCPHDSLVATTARMFFASLAGIFSGVCIATALGFPMTMWTGLVLISPTLVIATTAIALYAIGTATGLINRQPPA